MARRVTRRAPPSLDHYEVQSAANTIARARQHLADPKMMSAIKAHVAGLNAAVTGGLKPKKPKI